MKIGDNTATLIINYSERDCPIVFFLTFVTRVTIY